MQIQRIKQLCEKLPELYIPEENDYLIVETDASDITWSGCLKAKKAIKSLEQEKESLDSKYPQRNYFAGIFQGLLLQQNRDIPLMKRKL